jgi:hypothetical protein
MARASRLSEGIDVAGRQLLDLNAAGAMAELPRSLIGSRPLPPDHGCGDDPFAHWIAAIRGERRLAARTVRCQGDFWHAARSTVVFADELLTQERRGGCFGAEELCTLSRVAARLRAAGITIASGGESARPGDAGAD